MSIEVKVPMLPESVADATVLTWHKKPGEAVNQDETLVELETDKVVLEVPAPSSGVLEAIKAQEGATVTAEELLAVVAEGQGATPAKPEANAAASAPAPNAETPSPQAEPAQATNVANLDASPSVRKLAAEHGVDTSAISGSGKGGRVVKQDVVDFMQRGQSGGAPAVELPGGDRPEKRVPMSRLRARIAERLLSAQHNAAMLTTFNEIDMKAVMDLRKEYKDKFEKVNGVRLGFMSFFIKAVVEALKRFPAVNASIDDKDIVYHGYFDIGVAVSTERGLVVPVIRDADKKSMADIEREINDYAMRARENKLSIDELQGGTFTVTNGGVFGSLMSTPIINPPQVGILGMHKIEQRAIVQNGEVVVRPMMYVALSYDHRLIDGRESVQFLVAIKEMLEDPARLVLQI